MEIKLFKQNTNQWQYFEWDNDNPVLHFCHANSYSAGTYSPLLKRLAEHFHVYAVNNSGFGESRSAADLSDWHQLAADFVEFIKNNLQVPIIGVGHSLGALLTLYAATWYPEFFKRIILIDPVIFHPLVLKALYIYKKTAGLENLKIARLAKKRKTIFNSKEEILRRYSAKRIYARWREDFLEAYIEHGFRQLQNGTLQLTCDPENEVKIYTGIPLDSWKYLRKCPVPITIVQGEKSDTLTSRTSKRIKRKNPELKVLTLKNAGHLIPMEKPEEVLEIILRQKGK